MSSVNLGSISSHFSFLNYNFNSSASVCFLRNISAIVLLKFLTVFFCKDSLPDLDSIPAIVNDSKS